MPEPAKKSEPTTDEKMDAWSKRMDAMCDRMDAFIEEHGKKSAKRDAKKDEGMGEPEEMAADDAGDPDDDDGTEAPRQRKVMTDAATENALLEAQSKADAVAMHWGKRAPRAMIGESVRTYRRRLANMFREHSPDYRRADLSLISDPSAFAAAEKQIYADAVRASHDNDAQPRGVLREIQRTDQSGRIISEFVGSVGVTLDPFRLTPMRVRRIVKNPDALF